MSTMLVCNSLSFGAQTIELRPVAIPPVIDGRLDDVCWSTAALITDFRQVLPLEGALPTEKTEVRVTYDPDYLYVGISCYDSEANKIVAKEMQHDSVFGSDDEVSIVIDTFDRENDGYYFTLSAGGGKSEGLIRNNNTEVPQWDTIWEGKTCVTSHGWNAELAIPTKSLAFDPMSHEWGFNVQRIIRRKQEKLRWSGISRTTEVTALSGTGKIVGLFGMRQGRGLEFRPFASISYAPLRSSQSEREWTLKPGFDLTWHPAPSLGATLTVNTDFAEADVDLRQINLTRYSLQFPEKRDFFLRDSAPFAFGDSLKDSNVYFSRRIGLTTDGMPVDVLTGIKISGWIGPITVGLLDTQIDRTAEVKSKNLFVAHAAVQVLEQSSLGIIITNGETRANTQNSVVGLELNYINTRLPGEKSVDFTILAAESESGLVGGHDSMEMLRFAYPNEPFSGTIYLQRVGSRYDPALGFSPRAGIWHAFANLDYIWRTENAFIRSIQTGLHPDLFTNLRGRAETVDFDQPAVDIVDAAGDELHLRRTPHMERLEIPYSIFSNVVVPAGIYNWVRNKVEFISTAARPVSVDLTMEWGSFFGGSQRSYSAKLAIRPSAHVFYEFDWTVQEVRLPFGGFDARLGQITLNYALNPEFTVNTVVQYDNDSRTLGSNVRLRWTFRPGCDFYFIWGQNYAADFTHLRPTDTQLTTKAAWTFRF